jgi:hypothetical protein
MSLPYFRASSAALVALLAAGFALLSLARAETLDGSLRETVDSVPVPAAGASIVVTAFRPLHPAREWVRRGHAVFVPIRRGYGAKEGKHVGDNYGSCSRPDFRRAGEGAALDLLATADWAKSQRDLDPRRWLLAG